jgi:hypothetical protein
MSETQLFRVTEEHTPESVVHAKRVLPSPMKAFEPHPLLRQPSLGDSGGSALAAQTVTPTCSDRPLV